MNKIILILIFFGFFIKGFSQSPQKAEDNTLLKELAENGCKCVDSIDVYDKSNEEVAAEISRCIDAQTTAYQLGTKLSKVTDQLTGTDGKKEINISINTDNESDEYKKYYYEIERYMVDHCPTVNAKIATYEKQNTYSMSLSPAAREWYFKGVDELKAENIKKAIKYFEKAVEADPIFAFAWDNLGLCYRKQDNYDKAIEAYEKSLEIDARGQMPLQNIAIVYEYKKEYQKAIDAYRRLAEIDEKNPEVYYGIGRLYAVHLNNLEEGLLNMCTAYNLYVEQKSPYRADAEKIIGVIYREMKSQGKEDKFNEILKSKNIKTN